MKEQELVEALEKNEEKLVKKMVLVQHRESVAKKKQDQLTTAQSVCSAMPGIRLSLPREQQDSATRMALETLTVAKEGLIKAERVLAEERSILARLQARGQRLQNELQLHREKNVKNNKERNDK